MFELSRLLIIVIQMYYDDHSESHIHVKQAENISKIDLQGNLLKGSIPLLKFHIIKRWILLHQDELLNNWEKIRTGKQPERIKPWE